MDLSCHAVNSYINRAWITWINVLRREEVKYSGWRYKASQKSLGGQGRLVSCGLTSVLIGGGGGDARGARRHHHLPLYTYIYLQWIGRYIPHLIDRRSTYKERENVWDQYTGPRYFTGRSHFRSHLYITIAYMYVLYILNDTIYFMYNVYM